MAKLSIRCLPALAILCGSLSTAQAQSSVTEALSSSLPRGWQCLSAPNELDRPGRTFYTDREGVRYELKDLHDRLKPIVGEVSSVATQASGYVTAGLLVKLLRLVNLIDVSGSGRYSAVVSLMERQEVRTEEGDVRAALRTLDATLIDPQNTYYVVRNVQLARQMRLVVDESIAGAFGGEVPFNRLIQATGAARTPPTPGESAALGDKPSNSAPLIAAHNGSSLMIDETFGKPLTVCFLAQKFTLRQVGGGVAGTVKDAQLVDEYWRPKVAE